MGKFRSRSIPRKSLASLALRIFARDESNLLSLGSLVTVTQMTTMWQIKTHESLMGFHDSLVHLEVGWAATQALNIDAPFLGIQMESLESTSLASQLNCVDVLISTIISCTWVTLGVFIGHGRSQCIEDGAGGNIFGGDQDDGFSLTLNLKFLDLC